MNQQATIATHYKHSEHLSNRYSILLPNGQIPKFMPISFSLYSCWNSCLSLMLWYGVEDKSCCTSCPLMPAISGSEDMSEGQRLHSKQTSGDICFPQPLPHTKSNGQWCLWWHLHRHRTLCYNVKMTAYWTLQICTSSGSSAETEGLKSILFAFQPSQTPRRNSFTCPNHSWLHNW